MSPSPRTRQTVAVRREEILLAAIAEVERVGLAAVRVSDVAAALGISTGLVFYHFRTKDELVAEAFTYAVERDLTAMERAASRRGDVLDRIRAVLRSYGPTGSATGWRLWIDGWALAQHEPVIAAHFRRLEAQSRHTVRSLVDEGLAAGILACPDPDASVSRLLALLDGLSVAAEVLRVGQPQAAAQLGRRGDRRRARPLPIDPRVSCGPLLNSESSMGQDQPTMIRTTPFHERLTELNDQHLFTHWSGYLSALRFSHAPKHEYFAVRNAVGIFDTSPLFKYRISGPGAVDFLSGVVVRDLSVLRPGRAAYTLWCDDRGFVMEDGVVFRHSDNELVMTAARPMLSWLSPTRTARGSSSRTSATTTRCWPSRACARATLSRASSPRSTTSRTSGSPRPSSPRSR